MVRSCLGGLEDLARRPLLDDLALVEHHHPVGDVAGEAHLMGDAEHGDVGRLGELSEHREHPGHEFGVECGGHLVEEQHPGTHRQCSGDGHPLLLASGELVGVGTPLP